LISEGLNEYSFNPLLTFMCKESSLTKVAAYSLNH